MPEAFWPAVVMVPELINAWLPSPENCRPEPNAPVVVMVAFSMLTPLSLPAMSMPWAPKKEPAVASVPAMPPEPPVVAMLPSQT